MIIDKLYSYVGEKGNVCVGLDTSVDYIPEELLKTHMSVYDAIFEFNRRIIDATYDVASCYKVQIAYYEACGINGLLAYKRTLEYIREKGGIAIADIKRGDIAQTAKMYARAHFEGDFESDFVTLSPYMGMDSIEPYLDYMKNKEKGAFVLIRTSNPGAADIQYIEDSNKLKVYRHTADKIYKMSESLRGLCGYSSLGGVVGCTHIDEGAKIRQDYNHMFMLIPGYGAQGGGADDVALYLINGNGGVVNSSRGILLAYKNHDDGDRNFDMYARDEVVKMREAIWNAASVR